MRCTYSGGLVADILRGNRERHYVVVRIERRLFVSICEYMRRVVTEEERVGIVI